MEFYRVSRRAFRRVLAHDLGSEDRLWITY